MLFVSIISIINLYQCTKNQGGIVVYQSDGHGLVVASEDMDAVRWDDAKKICIELDLNGFNNWRLPTKKELDILYKSREKIGGFSDTTYWSSTDYDLAWVQYFKTGAQFEIGKAARCSYRPVRNF
jgi:hypothetical protein